MATVSAATQRAFAVWWKDLERWVIPPSLLLRRTLPAGWISVRIGALVRQVATRVKAEPETEYRMAGVRWYGEGCFHRETVRGDAMSAKQVTPLVPGALIYNRLFAWKASFAVVPADLADCYVSNEFPQFIPDTTRVLPEYLYLFCTREATIRAVNAASTGSAAVSRNRFKEEQFLAFEIPLPSLTEQKVIVTRWRQAREEITSARERARKHVGLIDARFFADLGLRSPDQLAMPKAFAVWWEDFRRWGVRFNQLNQGGADITQGKYPVVELDSVLDLVQYGTSEKANSTGKGVPVLRIGNIKDRVLDLTDLKHIPLSPGALNGLLLREGDVLIIRTSGSRDLVGTCAVFRGEGEYVFASYLIRLRFDTGRVVPEFASWFLNSLLGRQQVDAVSRQIMQNNINSEELRGLQIPLPPLAVQQQIMKRVASGRAEIARERGTAEKRSKTIDAEIEALIFGTKSLKDA
ncbi:MULTISPECIES: restriction endonuclease subunit S [unclassified Paraburkholderia]|uniref:restriction endonuclease subunit S n=1 Tax=unclassified Paraburkholderia TaxID=2615204 RepID=UPI00161EB889|nr:MULTISPECIES: restriction endonuclease subunit S [unclassified Paraburkholderia]MBB5441799.1 type I restriction enzyme S subunit [Paraburkholderia sp. WSM4177]MBB5482195.1 type I restriction enzyme S subunit [Paraburkholderia sp. WSM4180]